MADRILNRAIPAALAVAAISSCDRLPADPPVDPATAEQADARAAAKSDAERIMRDVQVDTLNKRVASLELEVETLKAHHAGTSALSMEKRLSQLEAEMSKKPVADTIVASAPPASAANSVEKRTSPAKPSQTEPAAKK